jgi:hypothetical protein
MTLNYVEIAVAVVVQFIMGAIWYSALFGKLWGRIHGFDKLSKAEQEALMKTMGPTYGLQLLSTVVATTVLAMFVSSLPSPWHAYGVAGWVWVGFILPTQVSAVIFSRTPRAFMAPQIAVMSGDALVRLMVVATIFSMMG